MAEYTISYKQANYRTRTTALTKEDGSVRDEVVMGRIGKKTDDSKTPAEYLYEPIAYDSPLEKTNILDKIDVAELIVYGKIPSSSIRIPTITDETYSPDFMYIVKKKDITKDNPSFPVSFERQINRQRMNDIIDRLITTK